MTSGLCADLAEQLARREKAAGGLPDAHTLTVHLKVGDIREALTDRDGLYAALRVAMAERDEARAVARQFRDALPGRGDTRTPGTNRLALQDDAVARCIW